MADSPEEFASALQRAISGTKRHVKAFAQKARVTIARRATQSHMQRAPIGPRQSKSGDLRIQTSRLARSLTGARYKGSDEGIFDVSGDLSEVRVEHGSRVPYARVHEEGFQGTVQVQSHQRTITSAFGRPLESATTFQVSAHSRRMNIPARPYLQPALKESAGEIAEHYKDLWQAVLAEAYDE
jgi:hypothetical protein